LDAFLRDRAARDDPSFNFLAFPSSSNTSAGSTSAVAPSLSTSNLVAFVLGVLPSIIISPSQPPFTSSSYFFPLAFVYLSFFSALPAALAAFASSFCFFASSF